MKFTLTYEGELRTSQRGRKQQLPTIRRHFHNQFKRLWAVNPFLKSWTSGSGGYTDFLIRDWLHENMPTIAGVQSIPIVFSQLHVECALDFRVLRSTESFGNTPDIDNQLKALIDALKSPQNSIDVGNPSDFDGMSPFFCLAQDDKLITHISSVSDEMLCPVLGEQEFNSKQCRVMIDVYIRPMIPTAANMIFFSDDSHVWDHRFDDQVPESLPSLSTHRLKVIVTQCIFRIQAMAKAFEGNTVEYIDAFENESISDIESWKNSTRKLAEASDFRRKLWLTTLWPKAVALKSELLRRISDLPPYPKDRRSSIAIDLGSLAGPAPLAEAAAELDWLVRLVP